MCQMKGRISYFFIIASIFLIVVSSIPQKTNVSADDGVSEKAQNVLVIFSSKRDEVDEHQRMLDMLIGHFSTNITFRASSRVQETDLDQVDYLFYYGQQMEVLEQSLVDLISDFTGVLVAVGYNAEQFGNRFSFLERRPNDVVIDQVSWFDKQDRVYAFDPRLMLNIYLAEESKAETLVVGEKGTEEYPLFIKNQTDYYFASNLLISPFAIAFAEGLHDVFQADYTINEDNPGYIRLEDIHPLIDPKQLRAIAEMLKEKGIPYMIAVIPVYTNPETEQQYHFSDYPDLINVLKYMQDNGGSIVLHGYTHQFRLSETGEGFEFWDVENNMPIYHSQDEEVVRLTREDFDGKVAYEEHLRTQKAYERAYIEERLTKGIQELANYGLYPLAFEAPHYTMSQNGYQVVSDYFSTYVGQIQLSDDNWEIMTTVPYITEPSFLDGMQLLPETIGYVDPDNANAIEEMRNLAQEYQLVRNGMVAGFFHPYLGEELFTEFIDVMETIPHVDWIDLKEMNNSVSADHVDIRSADGEIEVDINHTGLFMTSTTYLWYHIRNFINKIFWFFAGIGLIAVATFIIHIIFNSQTDHHEKRGDQVG